MITKEDYWDYQAGLTFGAGQGAWGYIGNKEREQRQQSSRPMSRTRSTRRCAGVASGPAAAPVRKEPGPCVEFGQKIADAILSQVTVVLNRVPRWVRLLVNSTLAIFGLLFVLSNGGGLLLACGACGTGWFAGRLTLGAIWFGLAVLFALLLFLWWLAIAGLVLGGIGLAGYVLLNIATH